MAQSEALLLVGQSTRALGGVMDASILQIEFAFDAPACVVVDGCVRVEACNVGSLCLDELKLEHRLVGRRAARNCFVGRRGEMRTTVGMRAT